MDEAGIRDKPGGREAMNAENMRDLDGPYGMGLSDYRTLTTNLREAFGSSGPGTILELGSGESTLQLAADYPEAKILSLENLPELGVKGTEKLRQAGAHNASILHAPVRTRLIGGGVYPAYSLENLPDGFRCDVLIVDGPVERLYPLGREAALYELFDALSLGGIVALDDYHRPSAKLAVRRWQIMHAGCLDVVEETPSFLVLRKVSEDPRGFRFVPGALASYGVRLRSMFSNVRRRISAVLK
jgi:hypothetical protein